MRIRNARTQRRSILAQLPIMSNKLFFSQRIKAGREKKLENKKKDDK